MQRSQKRPLQRPPDCPQSQGQSSLVQSPSPVAVGTTGCGRFAAHPSTLAVAASRGPSQR